MDSSGSLTAGLSQRRDLTARIRRGKDGVAGHEGVGAGAPAARDRLARHAAIHLEQRLASFDAQEVARLPNALERARNEALTAEAGVHRHHEYEVELAD